MALTFSISILRLIAELGLDTCSLQIVYTQIGYHNISFLLFFVVVELEDGTAQKDDLYVKLWIPLFLNSLTILFSAENPNKSIFPYINIIL